MSIQTFFKSLTRWPTRVSALQELRRPTRRSRQSSGFRPQLEALEDRCMLSCGIEGNSLPCPVPYVVSVPDAYTVAENQNLSVPFPGVTANDIIPLELIDGNGESYILVGLVAGPAHGALDLEPYGSFTYTPSAEFWGLDSFIYQAYACDYYRSWGCSSGEPTPVTILVTPEEGSTDLPPGITVFPDAGLVTTEAGGTAQFFVVLNSMPTADVVIPLSSSDTSEGTVSASSRTFTTLNWNVPQRVTVLGRDDEQVDGNQSYNIVTGLANSADPNYNGLNAADVAVTNIDNDLPPIEPPTLFPGITVSPTSGLVTTEAGGTAQFSVVLDSMPVRNVVIPLSSNDTTEGTVSASSLTFTMQNWSVPQTVTVTGKDDVQIDYDQPYSIVTGRASSADSNYNGLNADDVGVYNNDNDVYTEYRPSPQFTKSIPDRATIVSTPITINDSYAIQDVNVSLDIDHTYDADLDVFLVGPDGSRVELFTDVGGSGDNFRWTSLDDEASTAITAGQAPFSGSYRPEGSLAVFDGKNVQGTWTLEITDDFRKNTGRFNGWILVFEHVGSWAASSSSSSSAASSSSSSDADLLAALLAAANPETRFLGETGFLEAVTPKPAIIPPSPPSEGGDSGAVDAFFAAADLDDPRFAFDGLKEDYLDPITGEWLTDAALLAQQL